MGRSSIRANVEYALGHTVLRKCTRITQIACNINLLKALVCSLTAFAHHALIEFAIPWELLLSYPAGRQLFDQLIRLRTNGGTMFFLSRTSPFRPLRIHYFPVINFRLTLCSMAHDFPSAANCAEFDGHRVPRCWSRQGVQSTQKLMS